MVKQETYNPPLGGVNRYENARYLNRELAEEINRKAAIIAAYNEPLVRKIQENPGMACFHDPLCKEGKWIGHHLKDEHKKVVHELYGVASHGEVKRLPGVPSSVIHFLTRTWSIQT